MRWLDGPRVVPGVIPAPLLLRWYNGDVQLVIFSFLSLLSKLFILEWGTVAHWLDLWTHDHKVVGAKEIEIDTTAESLRFRLYLFFFFKFILEQLFFRWFHAFLLFLAPLC